MGKYEYSQNELAEEILGKRDITRGAVILDEPCELGYHCPVCKYELVLNGNYDERLSWSEYNSFLWCSVCNKDYPSCLCQPDTDKATEIFLSTMRDCKEKQAKVTKEETARELFEKLEVMLGIVNKLGRVSSIKRCEWKDYLALKDSYNRKQ